MITYIALLYSITIADGKRLVMSELKAMAAGLHLQNPRTVLATGNLIFEADDTSASNLESRLETAYADTFGRRVDIIVLTASEWKQIVASNPFPRESETDASHIITRIQRKPLSAETLKLLEPYVANGEQMKIKNGHLWIHFARDIGHSKLAAAMTIKRLGQGTSRNWNTIRRIAEAIPK